MEKRPQIALRGFRPEASGPGQVLGELESSVIEILWAEPGLSVVEVETRLRRTREIAHTTVLTTLDRMHRKGYLTREKQGKAFLYSPAYSRQEFEHRMAQEVLGALIGNFAEPALSAFVDLVAEDAGALDHLEELIRAKRRDTPERGKR
jgi:predicted transcriptional regulator